jgi:hypothetical protein
MAKFVKTQLEIFPHIKPNFNYKVLNVDDINTEFFKSLVKDVPEELFVIVGIHGDWLGKELLCRYKTCAHLAGANWEVIEEDHIVN